MTGWCPPPSRRTPSDRPEEPHVSSPTRREVSRLSAPVLAWLSMRPKVLLPIVSVALLLGGLALPTAYGVPLLVLLLLVVGWLVYLSWPVVAGPARVVRLVLLALLAVAIFSRLV
jgi:hypothetical protein